MSAAGRTWWTWRWVGGAVRGAEKRRGGKEADRGENVLVDTVDGVIDNSRLQLAYFGKMWGVGDKKVDGKWSPSGARWPTKMWR